MSARASFCTFHLGDQLFGVEVEGVREVVRDQVLTRVPLAPPAVRGLVNLRGRILAVVDLRRCLEDETEDGAPAAARRAGTLVVLRETLGDVGLLADDVHEVCTVDEERFERTPATVTGIGRRLIRGAYKLTDRLLLVLDIPRTLEAAGAQGDGS